MDGSDRELSVTYSSQQLITATGDSQPLDDENLNGHRQRNLTQSTENVIPKQHIYTVAVLCFINLINYMDRFTIAGMFEIH